MIHPEGQLKSIETANIASSKISAKRGLKQETLLLDGSSKILHHFK